MVTGQSQASTRLQLDIHWSVNCSEMLKKLECPGCESPGQEGGLGSFSQQEPPGGNAMSRGGNMYWVKPDPILPLPCSEPQPLGTGGPLAGASSWGSTPGPLHILGGRFPAGHALPRCEQPRSATRDRLGAGTTRRTRLSATDRYSLCFLGKKSTFSFLMFP